MFKRRHVIHSFAALAAPGAGKPFAEGGQRAATARGDAAGRAPLDTRRGAGQGACGVLVVLKANGRGGKAVFAEAGEMFSEDVEGLKKFL